MSMPSGPVSATGHTSLDIQTIRAIVELTAAAAHPTPLRYRRPRPHHIPPVKRLPVILRVPSNRAMRDSAKAVIRRAAARMAAAQRSVPGPGTSSFAEAAFLTAPQRRLDVEAMPSYPGMALDPTYAAVPERLAHAHLHRDAEEIVEASQHFTVRAHLHLEETKSPPHKAGDAQVFVEMRLDPFVNCMVEPAVGTARDVGERLNLTQLKSMNLTGEKVAIAILDTGIHLPSLTRSLGRAPRFDAQACWNPQHTPREPGSWKAGHGTMCAFDALIAAPDATLVDFPLLEVESPSPDGMMFPYVSSAMRAYGALLASRAHGPLKQYQALVVSNSWGIYHPDDDYPAGHPGRFSDNPTHPFNVQLAAATRAGIDILFAAGNCGRECPSPNCRSAQGNAIMGCAGLPEILTVAGCDIHGVRAGFSSQGPSIPGMAHEKPDVMAYTHFLGSSLTHDSKPDTGTSAACPVAAGCVAALRSSPQFDPITVPPAKLFERLRATAERPAGIPASAWDGDHGWGIISPLNAAT